MTAELIHDYASLFLNDIPLMDVRAPVEFQKGAFPNAINVPLLDDIERQKVGICFKRDGQAAAIELGHQLVNEPVKTARMAQWSAFTRRNPNGVIYCFRGGLRSSFVQQWLDEAGFSYPRVAGGYKALRSFLLNVLAEAIACCEFWLVGGMTGCGKTEVIQALPNSLDLERFAHHRGSSFGRHATPQPSQIDFENRLIIDLLKKRNAGLNRFVLEDEGRIIGRCALPYELYQGMKHYPLIWLEDGFDERVERILRDYVVLLLVEFERIGEGFEGLATYLRNSLNGIVKRLGGERYARLSAAMERALTLQRETGSVDLHRDWISGLLRDYYDPMYVYQSREKADRIRFRGDRRQVLDYLDDLGGYR